MCVSVCVSHTQYRRIRVKTDYAMLSQYVSEVQSVMPLVCMTSSVGLVVVLGSIIAVRLWWYKRKLAKSGAGQPTGEAGDSAPGQGPAVIEGEYQVLQGQKDDSEPPQA